MNCASWNPWHGCTKISPGCENCYVYGMDKLYNRDSALVVKNKSFDLPVRKNKKGDYKIPGGSVVYTCFTSDFFHPDADGFRDDVWAMIKRRNDLCFLIITKRIDRFKDCVPSDWGRGYNNVHISCTVENQDMADYRLPIFLKSKIAVKSITCSPLIENINLTPYLNSSISMVTVGGESGPNARICKYSWVLNIKNQCAEKNISFKYHQTGARLLKDGRVYFIKRKYQHSQAHKADIDSIF